MRVAYCRPHQGDWAAAGGPPAGWEVPAFSDCAALERCLRDEPLDAVVMRLPDDPAVLIEALSRVRVAAPGLPVIVAADAGREQSAVAAVVAGASDYWLDSMSALRLRVSVEQAVLRRRGATAQTPRDEALERVGDAVVVTDSDERIVYWNQAASRLYGYAYAEVVGRLLTETFAPLWLDAETRLKAWRAVAAKGVWLGDATHARRDGAPLEVSLEIAASRDGRGRRAGLLLVARPRAAVAAAPPAAAERDPRDARQFLEKILNSIADPVFVNDREHRMLLVNDALCAMTGRPREEILGRSPADYVPPEHWAVYRRQNELVFSTGQPNENEELFVDASGVTRVIVTKKVLAHDSEGRPIIVGVIRDVSAMVKVVEDLKRSQEQLRHAQKLEVVGRLAGGVAHDFNNILTAIVGCAGILLDSLPPGHPCREDAEEIRRAGEHAAALTRQLLAFSRREESRPRVVDLRAVFGGMRRMLQRLLPAAIEFELTVPDRLGAVKLDPNQAEQVLLNLVVNAGDAMPEGGRIAASLTDAPEGGGGVAGACVKLTVSDEGVGMDAATRARIFDPFFTTKASGTGLGLATVRDAVSRAGGGLEVESAPGRGTTFSVYWPRTSEPVEVEAEAAPAARRAARPARVLVIEDDDAVRRFAVRGLERAGYEVLAAADGAEALRVSDANEGQFDAVVVDLILPRFHGVELSARLRARQPTAKVLFISGYRPEETTLPRGADGSVRFLAKPFTGPALAERVRELLESR